MAQKKKIIPATFEETQVYLHKCISSAPRPLPAGRFPRIMDAAESEGFSREFMLNTLDLWLNYGYCRLIDPISQDIELTEEGMRHFY